jgi:hypothetical protein
MDLRTDHPLRSLADALDRGDVLPIAGLGPERLAQLLEQAAAALFTGPEGDIAQHVVHTLVEAFADRGSK